MENIGNNNNSQQSGLPPGANPAVSGNTSTENTEKKEQAKTTPDEGKTFDKETVFVCVCDCIYNKGRYRKGNEMPGKICPPHFIVKKEDKSKK